MSTNQQKGGVGWLNRMFFFSLSLIKACNIENVRYMHDAVKGHVRFFFLFL